MEPFSRRKFVVSSLGLVGVSTLMGRNGYAHAAPPQGTFTVSQVIDLIKKEITFDTSRPTVDTIKSGSPDQVVTGIVTTMFTTIDVIRKAVKANANFIIAHEPTFYNHLDETAWLQDHEVYRFKKDLLEKNKIAVWRFHDYIHAHRPDGVLMGVVESLGWKKLYNPDQPELIKMQGMKLSGIISHVKNKLGIEKLRYIGNPDQVCETIALLPGAWGGTNQISTFKKYSPDVLICGEISEWETGEYIRDVQAMGKKNSLIILGHSVSEEPGLEWLVGWLQPKIPGVKVTHIPSNNPFSWA